MRNKRHVRGLAEVLHVLTSHRVDFIIVGGVAATLQGAPVQTFDLDVVCCRSKANIERLFAALDAPFRDDPRSLRPAQSHLASAGHKLLITRYGPLDLLGTIEEATSYEHLLEDSEQMDVGGARARVLSLERLIRVKEQLARPKDKNMLLILQATLAERRKL